MKPDPTNENAPRPQEAAAAGPCRLTRRRAVQCALVGAAGLAGVGAGASWFSRLWQRVAPADVFKGDAPNDAVWAQWQSRGWVKEGSHYLKLGANVQCKICPNNCLLAPGDRSHCRNRVNRGGTLYTLAYGNPCTVHVDPVEKKPLFHFQPGARTFSLATSGCVFRCLNCQNWEISQKKPEETKDPTGPPLRLRSPLPSMLTTQEMARLSLFPEDVVAVSRELSCAAVAYTYSEPTAFYEYAYDTCRQVRAGGLKNVLVTCGSIEERPLRDIAPFVDAAHVDLKGFDEEIYRALNAGKLQSILNTLKLYRSLGVWIEVVNLLVPTYTDNPETIGRMCGWLVENLGPDQPVHFSRFQPQHKLSHLAPTPLATLVRARELARKAGLRYVYLGNAPELADAETTWCPECRRALVERDLFTVTSFQIEDGKCKYCHATIPGVWKA